MAVNYIARKCDCGGKLQLDEKRKVWVCMYCGSEVERVERLDGLGINNLVRQTLLDIAYQRMDSADKNLGECEKTDPKHIGTIIANISVLIAKATLNPKDRASNLTRLKYYHNILVNEYPNITDEEESLYAFCESSDIYASLLMVFNLLNQHRRCEYLAALLDVSKVFSAETNKSLLGYALKKPDYDMADRIVGNTENIDIKYTLSEVLSQYPDNEKKRDNIQILFKHETLSPEDRQIIHKYILEGKDSLRTKALVLSETAGKGIKIDIDKLICLFPACDDEETARSLMGNICRFKLSDEETGMMLDYCLSARSQYAPLTMACLESLKATNQYVAISSKMYILLLSESKLDTADLISILKKLLEFTVDTKTGADVLKYYLCFNNDGPERRAGILDALITRFTNIPAGVFETYVLKSTSDKQSKPEVVKRLLALTNVNIVPELLSQYILSCPDPEEIKDRVIDLLMEKNLRISPKVFSKYISSETDSGQAKFRRIKKLAQKGIMIESGTISTYLCGLKDFSLYDPEILGMLLTDNSAVNETALANYLLYCREPVKANRFEMLASKCGKSANDIICTIRHLNNTITCNLIQGYILLNDDPPQTATDIINHLLSKKTKINAEMTVQMTMGGSVNEKLKKYICDNRAGLSNTTGRICEEFKVFSMVF